MKAFSFHLTRLSFVFSFLLLPFASHTQKIEPVFGVAIGYNNMNELYHLVAYQKNGTNLMNKMILRRDQFIYYFSGYYPSKFNPTRINYFEQYEIIGGVYVDSISNQKIPYCPALDSLWKLRFNEFPLRGGTERFGWAHDDLRPSGKQMEYLRERYHITEFKNEYILGEYFLQLLRDLTDEEWIANYKNM